MMAYVSLILFHQQMDQENPESLPSPKYKVNSQHMSSSINFQAKDTQLNSEAIRLKVLSCSKKISDVWGLSQKEVVDFFMEYESLPNSKIVGKELVQVGSKIVKSENKIYLGQVEKRKKSGKGISIYKSGRIYEGQFLNNEKTGNGCEVFENGNFYSGTYSQNKKHGQGSFYWFNLCEIACTKNSQVNIQQYHGQWWGGLPDGQGQHSKANGDYYIGSFKNGLKHGAGKETYSNGDIYDGDFVNGLPEGYGEYIWLDKAIYKGDFKQGYRNGYGIWESPDKRQKYTGHFLLDKKHGYGVWEFGDEMYKGNYVEGERCGEGQLYMKGELIYKGLWQGGKTVNANRTISKGKTVSISKSKSKSIQKSKSGSQSKKKASTQNFQSKDEKESNFRLRTTKVLKTDRVDDTKTKKNRFNSSYCGSSPYGHRRCVACCRKEAERESKKFDNSFT